MYRPRRALPGRRHSAGVLHRRSGAGDASACRRQHAASGGVQWLSIVPIAESRSSYNGLAGLHFRRCCPARSPPLPSTGWRHDKLRRAPAWDCGYPDSEHRNAIHRVEFRPADPARVRHAPCFARARSARCRRRAIHCAGAPDGRTARSDLGRALRADRRRRRVRCGTSQCSAIPHHPPLSDAWSSQRWSSCSWCWRYGHDPRSRLAGRADVAGASARAAAHRLCAQGEGAAAAAAGAAAAAALSRSRAPAAQGGRAGATTRPGCSASFPTSSSPAPGSPRR